MQTQVLNPSTGPVKWRYAFSAYSSQNALLRDLPGWKVFSCECCVLSIHCWIWLWSESQTAVTFSGSTYPRDGEHVQVMLTVHRIASIVYQAGYSIKPQGAVSGDIMINRMFQTIYIYIVIQLDERITPLLCCFLTHLPTFRLRPMSLQVFSPSVPQHLAKWSLETIFDYHSASNKVFKYVPWFYICPKICCI